MNHRKMPPLSEMERIEQSLLGEKLDEMLDRIEKEDIAYVITEHGKDKLVLCPIDGLRRIFLMMWVA